MIRRLLQCLLTLAIILDITVQGAVKAPIYVLTGYAKPSPRETISATIGNCAAKGWCWAIILQSLVDDVFGTGHCERAWTGEQTIIGVTSV